MKTIVNAPLICDQIYTLLLKSFLSILHHLPLCLSAVPGSGPSLISAPVLLPAVGPPACRPGAASSPVAAAAVRYSASAGAGAGAGDTVTPLTGATAAVHPGTPSLGVAAGVGVALGYTNATKQGIKILRAS